MVGLEGSAVIHCATPSLKSKDSDRSIKHRKK